MTQYTLEYFIEKFDKIPDEEWCVDRFESLDHTKKCALGHCGMDSDWDTDESLALRGILYRYNLPDPVLINDDSTGEYGDTPRERILNVLSLIAAIKECGE